MRAVFWRPCHGPKFCQSPFLFVKRASVAIDGNVLRLAFRDIMTGAYSFVCQYSSTDKLILRLRELSNWDWRIGDSAWYGQYLACKPYSGVRIRIVDFPESASGGWKYDSDIRRRSPECTTPMTEIDEAYRKLLAQIPAEEVKEIEWFD
jgi:hypothetical protein